MTRRNPLPGYLSSALAILSLASAAFAAEALPVDLPPHEGTPAKKPVKVYILSGQSNMVGFGAVNEPGPSYANVFLSADPAAVDCELPVGGAALLKFGIYQSDTPDAPAGAMAYVFRGVHNPRADFAVGDQAKVEVVALGTTDVKLPSIEGEHTVVAYAFIDVPFDGEYEIYPGFESSRECVAEVDGKIVYEKAKDAAPVVTKFALKKGKRHPIRITYAQGGSAALWLRKLDNDRVGHLKWVVDELGRFKHLRAADGAWATRPDVMLADPRLGDGKGKPLGVSDKTRTFGPEVGFGFVMGAFHDEPVLVIKSCIGNRSLGWDILPPGTARYTHEGKTYPGYGETEKTIETGEKPGANEWYAGKEYDEFTAAIRTVLDNFGERFPEYKEQGYEVAGFVWWQGHKDGGNPAHIAYYEQNLTNLIKAWRTEFKAPNAPWTIATVAFQGGNMSENYQQIAAAQLAVADPARHPEFAGNVKTIDARPFWREPHVSPKNQDYHYNHNAETYMLTGDALGRAMVELQGGKAEYPQGSMIKPIEMLPVLREATGEQVSQMTGALRPIIMDRLLPEFAQGAANVPSYLRRGLALDSVLSGEKPKPADKPQNIIASQLDAMITHYQLAGIRDYDWQPVGPDMKTADWNYLTFDPAEKKEDAKGDRYRKITLPEGSDNWFSPEFDPAKAGWKTGKAPFGISEGKLEALSKGCRVPHCGCSQTPATLWENEVLLMTQTFDVPKLDPAYRYRIVVGGAGHPWSGEGFALYVDGKLVSEATGGYYKGGGDARGAIVFNDLHPAFEDGKVTIAVKAFQRRNRYRDQAGVTSGHMSVWLEAAKLSPVATEVAQKLTK